MVDELTSGNVLVAAIALASPLITILMTGRKVRRENEADVDAKISPVRAELDALTAKVADHVPRAEIEAADKGVLRIAEQAARDVGELRERHGRLDERQLAASAALERIEELVKEQGRDSTRRLDKVHDCLAEISRKVG